MENKTLKDSVDRFIRLSQDNMYNWSVGFINYNKENKENIYLVCDEIFSRINKEEDLKKKEYLEYMIESIKAAYEEKFWQ